MKLLNVLAISAVSAISPYASHWGECKNCVMDEESVELLEFRVAGKDIEAWMEADDQIWREFLSKQTGYKSKAVYYAQDCDLTSDDWCTVFSLLIWETLADWKALEPDVLDPVQDEFDEAVKDLKQEWVTAHPTNGWGFRIGKTHNSAFLLTVSTALTFLHLL